MPPRAVLFVHALLLLLLFRVRLRQKRPTQMMIGEQA